MTSHLRPVVNLLRVSRFPIFTQLLLEEALLRGTDKNWVLINDGAFNPAIVMGISGKPEELINIPKAQDSGIQVIKRFTGGGTVVVDEHTIFATLIFQGAAVPGVDCYPQPIMRWTEAFYRTVFGEHPAYGLRENDYVFGPRKFGGNAQAITGKRWLHHTSLLWDYDPARMALLAQPRKAPAYRAERDHEAFVVRLREVVCGEGRHSAPTSQQLQQSGVSLAAAGGVGMVGISGGRVPTITATTATSGGSGVDSASISSGEWSEAAAAARGVLLERLAGAASAMGFDVREASLSEASAALAVNKMWGTKLVDLAAHTHQAA